MAISPCTPVQTDRLSQTKDIQVNFWPDGYIKYFIRSGFTYRQMQDIRQAISGWEQKTNAVVFEEVYNETESALVFKPVDKGCSATIGYGNGKQEVKLSAGCDLISYKHELGHVLGLIHEHQRTKRDRFLVFPKATYDFIANDFPDLLSPAIDALRPLNPSYVDNFEFDFNSIMIYASYPRNNLELAEALRNNNNPLYVKFNAGCEMVERPTEIGDKDVKLIRQLYPRHFYLLNNTAHTFSVRLYTSSDTYAIPSNPGQKIELDYDYNTNRYTYNTDLVQYIDLNRGGASDDITFGETDITYRPSFNEGDFTLVKNYRKSKTALALLSVPDHDGLDGRMNLRLVPSVSGSTVTIKIEAM